MSFYWTDYEDLQKSDWEGTNNLTGARAPSVEQIEGGMKKPVVNREKMANVGMVAAGVEQLANAFYGNSISKSQMAIQKSDDKLASYLRDVQHKQAMTSHYTKINDLRELATQDVEEAKKMHRAKMAQAAVAGEEAGMAGQGRSDMYNILSRGRVVDLQNRITNYEKTLEEVQSNIYSDNVSYAVASKRNLYSYNSMAELLQGLGNAGTAAAGAYYDILYPPTA